MILLLYIILIFLCLVGIIIKPKTKSLQYIILMGIAYILGRAAVTADTLNYYYGYLRTPYKNFGDTYEPGYLLLTKVGHFFNLTYPEFRTITTFIALILINKLVNKLAGRRAYYFYIFYLCFHIFIDNEQHRSFLSFSLVIYGLSYLLFSAKTKGIVKYIAIVFLASTVHLSALLYLPFALVKLSYSKKLTQFIIIFTLVGCFLVFFNLLNIGIVKTIISLLTDDAERISGYGNSEVRYGFILAFFFQGLNILIMYLVSRWVKSKACLNINQNDPYPTHSTLNTINTFHLINLISIIYFPLYMFNVQFIRLTRNMFLLTLIGVAVSMPHLNKRFLKKYIILFITLISINFWFYYSFIYSDHIEDIVKPLFEMQTVTSR